MSDNDAGSAFGLGAMFGMVVAANLMACPFMWLKPREAYSPTMLVWGTVWAVATIWAVFYAALGGLA